MLWHGIPFCLVPKYLKLFSLQNIPNARTQKEGEEGIAFQKQKRAREYYMFYGATLIIIHV